MSATQTTRDRALTEHEVEILRAVPRHERARMLLAGEVGPLGPVGALAVEPGVSALAYIVYLVWIRGRVPGGFFFGKPSFEAETLLRSRVLTAGRRSGGLVAFVFTLFERCKQSIASLTTEDGLWWAAAQRSHSARWRDLLSPQKLTEACVAASLLGEWLREVPAPVDSVLVGMVPTEPILDGLTSLRDAPDAS